MSEKEKEDDLAQELDAILDSYDKNNEVKQDNVDEEQIQEFLARFERIKVETIRPTMEQVGKYLEKRGHLYQIKDKADIHEDNPSITMEIYPRTSNDVPIQEHEFPTISFIAEPDVGAVGIEVRDGMPGRPGLTRGHTTTLDALTGEYVKNQIVAVIKINFSRKIQKNTQ
ncbi:MAG: hypothetical protein QXX64_05070 [Nitrososphaera sp.]